MKGEFIMKAVINTCYGGFSLSEEAYKFLGLEWDGYGYRYQERIERTDSKLVECVETLGHKANGRFASLKVVEIPDNTTDWRMTEYDGTEFITAVVDGKMADIY